MTRKWQWILFVWHDWRAAIWGAERHLWRQGVRHDYAAYLAEWHHDRAHGYHRELFPPAPVDYEKLLRDYKTGRR